MENSNLPWTEIEGARQLPKTKKVEVWPRFFGKASHSKMAYLTGQRRNIGKIVKTKEVQIQINTVYYRIEL
jgi:hypothetical protein